MVEPVAFVIEDDEVISNIYAPAVTEAGYQTVIIYDGQDALEKLSKSVPDLVVLDMHLPKVSGVHVLKSIREDKRYNDTRVMIVSADSTLTAYMREEADLVLIKPIGFYQMRDMAIRLKPSKK